MFFKSVLSAAPRHAGSFNVRGVSTQNPRATHMSPAAAAAAAVGVVFFLKRRPLLLSDPETDRLTPKRFNGFIKALVHIVSIV